MQIDNEYFYSLYEKEANISYCARLYCEQKGIKYSEAFRKRCSRLINSKSRINEKVDYKSPAKVLLFDLETSPILGYFWSLWPNSINHEDIVQDWKLLCFSAKWLFDDTVISHRLTEKELSTRNDKRITTELWRLLDQADIVIAHNAKKFDIKKSNAKFIEHELNLPAPYQVIDTLEHARKRLGLTSNRLDYISKFFGFDGKMDTPKGLWKDVMNGDYSKLIIMDEYCKQDVTELENVYLKMRPYIQPHPNIGLHIADNVLSCPSCGEEDLNWDIATPYRTNANEYKAFRCNCCGSLGRSRTASFSRKFMSNLTAPNPR